jgi:hypothetical protein
MQRLAVRRLESVVIVAVYAAIVVGIYARSDGRYRWPWVNAGIASVFLIVPLFAALAAVWRDE